MISDQVKYFHYFGEHILIGLFSGETFLLNPIQKQIVFDSFVSNNRDEVIECFINKTNIIQDEREQAKILLHQYFDKLEAMGIINIDRTSIPRDINSINITGIQGKFYPYRLTFELTNACIANCSHCFKKANEGKVAFLDMQQIRMLFEEVGEQFQILHLSGGEPLLHPCFENIIHLFRDKHIELNTNGILINQYRPELFKNIDSISIGIYGLSDAEYLEATGIKNGYSKLCKSCSVLKSNNIPFAISLVINKKNLKHLPKYVDIAYQLGAKEFIPGLANRIGRLEYLTPQNTHWVLSKEEKRHAYKTLRELGKKYEHKMLIDDWGRDVYRSENIIRESEKVYTNHCFQCGAGTTKWTITENFSFKPCTMFLDCPGLEITYEEWVKYINGTNEIIWDNYLQSFVNNCHQRGTCPSEYCDYMAD